MFVEIPEVPEDLINLPDADLQALVDQFNSIELGEIDPATLTDEQSAQLDELATSAERVATEVGRRTANSDRLAATRGRLSEMGTLAPPEPEVEAEEDDPEAVAEPEAEVSDDDEGGTVVAARAPRVADLSRRGAPTGPQTPVLRASMSIAAEVPGMAAGQKVTEFSQAAKAVEARLDAYSASGRMPGRARRPIQATEVRDVDRAGRLSGVQHRAMTRYSRHRAVNFQREYPEELRLSSLDGSEVNLRKLEAVASEKRLTGGSLVASLEAEVKAGRNLVAAQGWCAISENIYDLCEQESMDGLLSLPEVTADRGGFNLPVGGGIDFASIFTSIGDAGDTHLTEEQVIEETLKVCTEIPCPEFEEVRLGVDYVCLTGSLLQRRGYPEVIQRFSRGAMVALAHKINQGVIAGIAAGSLDGGTMADCHGSGGDDAAGALFSALEAAKVDILYRARMPFATTVEVVLPFYVIAQIRAALARRRGVSQLAVTDAEIMSMFAVRGIAPRFVYDWQDAFSGVAAGPGAAIPMTALPVQTQFLMYPAGTWVKATADVVNLDTIYDSTLLQTNQYTALFTEDAWAVMQMCPISRLFTVNIDPCGCLCGDGTVVESP